MNFWKAVSSVRRMGSWTEGDKKYAVNLKLEGGVFI
jgi:hypothetical protein